MLIIKILAGFLCIFCVFSVYAVCEEWGDAPLLCKITASIVGIMVLMLSSYCIGELFICIGELFI